MTTIQQAKKIKYGSSDKIRNAYINLHNGSTIDIRDRLEYAQSTFDEAWIDWDGFTYSIMYRSKGKAIERVDYPHTSVLSVKVEFETE